ncbi:MAG: class I SAM-dependent methyltransferase [Desulfobacter sp.]
MRKNSAALQLLKPVKNFGIHFWEKSNGLNTTRDNGLFHHRRCGETVPGYAPSGWMSLRQINRVINITAQDTLVDFGSGKGRLIYLAAHYPFKKIIGVEISESLHRIAQKNLSGRAGFACGQIELVHADACEYKLPDDVTIAYFFNPFSGAIFERVIENIRRSLISTPRKLWVVYKKPVMRSCLDNCDWLTLKHVTHNTVFYRSLLPEQK